MADISEEELELLGGLFLFREMPRAALSAMTGDRGCRLYDVEKGSTIYTPHDYERALGVILSGRVQVSKAGFVVSVLEPGELFGAAALYNDRQDYATTLTARTRCRVIFFSQALMSRAMADNAAVAGSYIRYLSGRIRFLEGKLDSLLAPGAEGRLAQYLLEHREGDLVTLDCSMSGLAQRLSLGRTSLYRAFETLRSGGAIEKNGKMVRILKEEQLL